MPFSRSIPQKKKRVTLVVSGALLFILAAVAVLGLSGTRVQPTVRDISFSQLRELSESGLAQKVSVSGEVVTVTQADGSVVRGVVTNVVAQHEVVAAFEKAHVLVEFETLQPGVLVTVLNYLLPATALLIFALIGWRVYASMGMQNESNASETGPSQPVTFQDVAGVDEARSELAETIEFLRDPGKFGRLGGRSPRGILLSGPPGTGKTLLARAAACEAEVPFLSVSGSSFQEKFAGLGAARVRRLFARARKLAVQSPARLAVLENDDAQERILRASADAILCVDPDDRTGRAAGPASRRARPTRRRCRLAGRSSTTSSARRRRSSARMPAPTRTCPPAPRSPT